IADPARLSVDDQMHRLASGRITPDKLDLAFLRLEGARYGHDALVRLQHDRSTPRAIQASDAAARVLAQRSRYDRQVVTARGLQQPLYLNMHPAGAPAPAQLLASPDVGGILEGCNAMSDPCDGAYVDLDGDGVGEVMVVHGYSASFYAVDKDQHWSQV